MKDAQTELASPKEGLTVGFKTVEELYAGEYAFNLPWFQRAYAWTDDMALRLLNDIHQAYDDRKCRYFIGHVLLARKVGTWRHVLVDGQQRAVTLMILFALLREKLAGTPWHDRLSPLLEAAAGPEGKRYRLEPQPAIKDFFRDHIQAQGAMKVPIDDYGTSEVESNLLNNRVRMDERLTEIEEAHGDLAGLAEFVLTRCLLVLEVVDDETDNEAWKMLQTEENTGLPFHNSARAKVTLIEAMPAQEREAASKEWDRCQSLLGNDGMQQLVTYIRDLSRSQRSSQPVEKDIVTRFRLNENGLKFINDHLVPSAERLIALRSHQVGEGADRGRITRHLRQMEWSGHGYWTPAAMRWLEKRGPRHPETVEFFRRLARKVWLLRISGVDAVEYERRFIALSNEIAKHDRIEQMPELKVADKYLAKTRENLSSRTFYDKRYCRAVLRYLSDLLGDDPGEIDGGAVTVEHVLPRNPGRRSRWSKEFGDGGEISNYAHRIGNLALLSFQDNQHVGNQEFVDKREVLAGCGFALSADAAAAEKWSPEHIMARSDRLVRVIFDHWGVPFDPAGS